MTKRVRRNHSPAFKAKVALAALKGEKTPGRIGATIRRSRQPDHAMEGAASARGCRSIRSEAKAGSIGPTVDLKALHAKIGELTLENDFLEGALGKAGMPGARPMIDRSHDLPIAKQAKALGISRGSVYSLPRPVPAADLVIML